MIDVEQEIRAHRDALLLVAYNILKCKDTAEDVIQKATLKAWKCRDRYDPAQCPTLSWLCVIIQRTAIDALRARKRQALVLQKYSAEMCTAVNPCQEDTVAWRQASKKLASVVRLLPEEQRTVLDLRYGKEYSDSQITEHLCIPLGTVKSRIRLALAALRTQKADLVF